MSAVTDVLAGFGEPYTVDDLDAMPDDDGRRRELIDGALIVSPAPSRQHQKVSVELEFTIKRALPEHLEMLHAPFDVRLDRRNNLQPDVLVAPKSDFTDANLPVAPLLAVEVLSPSTRHIDIGLKRSKYESLGTAHYWVVDPIELWITTWELQDDRYVETAHVEGDDELVVERPFPLRVVPSGLIA
jgi:Uma2 family endonuclease